MKRFCIQMPDTQETTGYRTDYITTPILNKAPFNATFCSQNVSAIAQDLYNNVSSVPGAQYLITFFTEVGANMLVELKTQKLAIILSCVLSLVIAYLVLLLIRFIIGFLVWLVILVVIVGGGLLAAWFIYMGIQMQKENEYREVVYGYVDLTVQKKAIVLKTVGSVFAIIACVGLLVTCACLRSIRISVSVIKVSTDALRKLFWVSLVPLVFIPLVVGHAVWTVGGAYYFNCMGEFDVKYNEFNFKKIEEDETTHVITQTTDSLNLVLFLVLVFAIIWGVFFFYSCLEFIISAVVTQWYFSEEPRKSKGFLKNGIKMMFKQIGSLIISSCITSIVVWLRWFFEYVYKRAKKNEAIKNNKTVKALAWLARCCLKCLEKFIRYTNRNAQTVAAITGHNYCKSVGLAMKFQFTNLKTVVILNTLGDFMLWLCKVFITVLTGVLCFILCKVSDNSEMVFTPTLLSVAVGYIVAFYVIELLEIIVDVIFMSFLYENEFLAGDRAHGIESFAPSSLKTLLERGKDEFN